MPNITLTSPSYARGGTFESPQWETSSTLDIWNGGGAFAWVKFSGASTLMDLILSGLGQNADINSATLTISGLPSHGSGESLSARLDISSSLYPDVGLPVDLADALDRTVSDASTVSVGESDSSVEIDVASLLAAIGPTIADGDSIGFKIENPTYSGSGLGGMTASLSVSWTPRAGSPVEAELGDISATATVETLEAGVEVGVTLADIDATATVETASAIVPPIAELGDIDATAAVESLEASSNVEVELGDIEATATIDTLAAGPVIAVELGDISATATVETASAIVPPIVELGDIVATATVERSRYLHGWRMVEVRNWRAVSGSVK